MKPQTKDFLWQIVQFISAIALLALAYRLFFMVGKLILAVIAA